MQLKDIIKTRRKELKLTMLDIANACGVSEATVSRWENGKIINMQHDKVAALAKILRVSPSVIVGDEEENKLDNTDFLILLQDFVKALEHFNSNDRDSFDKSTFTVNAPKMAEILSYYYSFDNNKKNIIERFIIEVSKIDSMGIDYIILNNIESSFAQRLGRVIRKNESDKYKTIEILLNLPEEKAKALHIMAEALEK